MDEKKINKKRKKPPSENSESDTESQESEHSNEVLLDIEEITKVAIQELLCDEDFQKMIFRPTLNQVLMMQPHQEEEKEEEKCPYLSKMNPNKRKRLDDLEKKILTENNPEIPLKYRVLESDISNVTKKQIIEKINHFDTLQPMSSEYQKLRKYIKGLEKIPFGTYSKLTVTKRSNKEKISNFMKNLYSNLSKLTYGQEEAKSNILEVVAKWISNPCGEGNVVGLCGPPGIGKTSLIKNGLSKCLNMPFSFVGLGGATCSASLQGHDYTYEGSKWGRIVEILIETGSMNPIIFFDELDKVSETKSGEEINGLLTHLTDPSQNNSFHDKYFSGIDFDLSKCLFIFSFNDEHRINPVLRDRIKIIRLKGFDKKEKIEIAKQYSIPKICKNIGFDIKNIEIPDLTLEKIIESYCPESGVRKLEKCIETLMMKINLYSMTGNPESLSRNKEIKLETPYKIEENIALEILDGVFKRDSFDPYKFTMYS